MAGHNGMQRHRYDSGPHEQGRRMAVACGPVAAGRSIAVLYGLDPAGMWPLTRRRWWPRPRVTDGARSNARWCTERCSQCRGWRALLVALRDVQDGEEVTTAELGPILGGHGREWAYEIAFDGGARLVRGRRVAGAGVVIWGPLNGDGQRRVVARAVIAMPGQGRACFAEAYGCRVALLWVAGRGGAARTVRIAGDNLAVIRYCAHTGLLRRPLVHSLLEQPLGEVYARGWSVDWILVRRNLNREADAMATAGVFRAAEMADRGLVDTEVSWELRDSS